MAGDEQRFGSVPPLLALGDVCLRLIMDFLREMAGADEMWRAIRLLDVPAPANLRRVAHNAWSAHYSDADVLVHKYFEPAPCADLSRFMRTCRALYLAGCDLPARHAFARGVEPARSDRTAGPTSYRWGASLRTVPLRGLGFADPAGDAMRALWDPAVPAAFELRALGPGPLPAAVQRLRHARVVALNADTLERLAELPHLETVQVSQADGFRGADAAPLARARAVDAAGWWRLADAAPLARADVLDLSMTGVSDVSMLRARTLTLAMCAAVSDVSALRCCVVLHLQGTAVTDVSALTNVRELDVSHTRVASVPLPQLQTLRMRQTAVTDVGHLTDLRELDISGCADVRGVLRLKKLTDLTARETRNVLGLPHDDGPSATSADLAARAARSAPDPPQDSLSVRAADFSFSVLTCGELARLGPVGKLALQKIELHGGGPQGSDPLPLVFRDVGDLHCRVAGAHHDFETEEASVAIRLADVDVAAVMVRGAASMRVERVRRLTLHLERLVPDYMQADVHELSVVNTGSACVPLPALASAGLHSLTLSHWPRQPSDLEALNQIPVLALTDSDHITDISPLVGGSTRALRLESLPNLNCVRALGALGSLRRLSLQWCGPGITDVSMLGRVHTLTLAGLSRLSDVSALGGVHELTVAACPWVCRVAALNTVHTLTILRCDLVGVSRAGELRGVHTLTLRACQQYGAPARSYTRVGFEAFQPGLDDAPGPAVWDDRD